MPSCIIPFARRGNLVSSMGFDRLFDFSVTKVYVAFADWSRMSVYLQRCTSLLQSVCTEERVELFVRREVGGGYDKI